jgi:hypothetical protein
MSSFGPPSGPYPGSEPPWRDQGPPDAAGEPPYGSPADPWGNHPTEPASPAMPGPMSPPVWGGPPQSGPSWAGQPPSVPVGQPTSSGHPGPASYEPGYAQPQYPPPGYPQPGYEPGHPQPGWGPAPAAPSPGNRRQTVLIVVVAVLALLLGVGGFAAFLLTGDERPGGQSGTSTGPTGAATGEPTGEPTGAATQGEPSAAVTQASTGPTAGDVRFVTAGQCLVNDGTNGKPQMRVVTCRSGTYEVLKRFDGTVDYKTRCATVPGYEYHFFYDSQLDVLDFVLCMKKR